MFNDNFISNTCYTIIKIPVSTIQDQWILSRKAQIQVARDDQEMCEQEDRMPRIDVDVIDILTTDFLPDLYQIFT